MDLAILIAIACQRFMQDIAHTLACHFRTSLNKTITLNFFFFKTSTGKLSKYFLYSQISPEVILQTHTLFCLSQTTLFRFCKALIDRNCFIKTKLFLIEGTTQRGRVKAECKRQNIDMLWKSEHSALYLANPKTVFGSLSGSLGTDIEKRIFFFNTWRFHFITIFSNGE